MRPPFGLFADADYRTTVVRSSPATASSSSRTACSSATPPRIDLTEAIGETGPFTRARRSADWPTASCSATGHALQDDATVLCLDWHGGHGRDRDSHRGAEQNRASQPLA